MKPPVARKLAVRHTKFVCLTLATGCFKLLSFQNACMVYKHAYLNTLLLLHSAFIKCGEDAAKRGGWEAMH